jgi:hypothetical protein
MPEQQILGPPPQPADQVLYQPSRGGHQRRDALQPDTPELLIRRSPSLAVSPNAGSAARYGGSSQDPGV